MDVDLNCPHCGTTKAGFTGVYAHKRQGQQGQLYDVLAFCRVCQAGVVICVTSLHGRNPVTEWHAHRREFTNLRVYPTAASESAPEHTPPPIAKDFKEGLNCLRRSDFNAAGMMFRKALQRATTALAEIAGMDRFKAKTPLQHRIDALAKQGHLSEPMRALAEVIKLDGNAAAHDEDQEFDKAAASQTREFVELFLTYAFNLPERVRRARQAHDAPSPTTEGSNSA